MRLVAEDVAAFRGERLVLRDITLGVAAGGALLLLGPNGAGKSTLLRLLAGLVPPAAGRLTWDGADRSADPGAAAGIAAYLGHQDAVKPGLTAAENLLFAAGVTPRHLVPRDLADPAPPSAAPRTRARIAAFTLQRPPSQPPAAPRTRARIAAALAALDLLPLADMPARMLSAGQRRRLALSRLALSAAPLWLLDEPTLGLDDVAVGHLARLLERHRAAGGVVVAATHLPVPLPGAAELHLG